MDRQSFKYTSEPSPTFTVSLRHSSDPFLTLQRVTKGTMRFLDENGVPFSGDLHGDDSNKRRNGIILICFGAPLLFIGAVFMVAAIIVKTKKKTDA